MIKDTLKYLLSFKKSGIIFPSSPALARKVASRIPYKENQKLIELGGGNGVITREILKHMLPGSKLASVELNAHFAKSLEEIDDDRLTVLHQDIFEIFIDGSQNQFDAIISCLPLTLMRDDKVDLLLKMSRESLKPGGYFVQYQYSPAILDKLRDAFIEVDLNYVLFNAPPAIVFTGKSPV